MMEDPPHLAKALVLLWLAAVPLMGSPGPATLSLAGIGAAYGFRPGLPYLAGVVAGTTGVLVMIATGVTALILARPELVALLTVLAAVYIVYLAWRIATAPVGQAVLDGARAPAFAPGFLLALANPKAFAAIGAVYAGHTVVEGRLGLDTGVKLVALGLVIVLVNTAWLAFGASFSRFLQRPRIGRAANIVFAAMLLASVGLALITA